MKPPLIVTARAPHSFILVFAALLAFFGSATPSTAFEGLDGFVVHKTAHDYPTLVERLNAAVKAEGMLLVTRASATAGAKAQGITIPGNMIVGVYRNDFARRMLAASIPAGIEAPIRYYITENDDGTATLSYRTPTAVFTPYFGDGGAPLQSLAAELDTVFDTIAKRAIQ